MNETIMYDQFSQDYDRFVNWPERLKVELPFLISEFSSPKSDQDPPLLLDAACGTGQHIIALAREGFRCMGADYSPGMVKIARRNASQADLNLTIKKAGFGQLAKTFGTHKFDGLMCLGNSLPHILNETDLVDALFDFQAVLRKGGKLILQNRNFDKVMKAKMRWMDPQTHTEEDRVWIFNRFYDFDPDERITFNIQILRSESGQSFDQTTISTRLWPLKLETITSKLLDAGFQKIKLYGDLQGSEFHADRSDNLVVTTIA